MSDLRKEVFADLLSTIGQDMDPIIGKLKEASYDAGIIIPDSEVERAIVNAIVQLEVSSALLIDWAEAMGA